MKRKTRESIREAYDSIKQANAEAARKAHAAMVRREAAILAALQRKKSDSFASHDLKAMVSKRAPKVLRDDAFNEALARLDGIRSRWVRPLAEWEPKGKGASTLFRSLCEHLLATYITPAFLWRTFFLHDRAEANALIPIVVHVANGGSLFKLVQDGSLSVPLTRKMCHDVLSTPGDWTLLGAIRRAQIKAEGGDRRLWGTWMKTPIGSSLHQRATEEFWQTVIRFLVRNPMFDHEQVSPLLDYINFKRNEDAAFSMKGRSANALFRDMEAWHADLQKVKLTKDVDFKPSGFRSMEIDRSRRDKNGNHIREIWRVFEILSGKELADEGRAMSHCVWSYARSIECGQSSIWSITKEDATGNWRMLTVEVRNASRQIVQARGRFNAGADSASHQILLQWANMNILSIKAGWV